MQVYPSRYDSYGDLYFLAQIYLFVLLCQSVHINLGVQNISNICKDWNV